ncbi:MAG: hypothetical protein HZA30_00650, partial [Candidatus Omnitrophica bacterium]|nr:hypothetical protein [Candidatus Omnitrophota bacterium]
MIEKKVQSHFILLVTGYWLLVTFNAAADTIHLKDGRELKGIVVEDYRDRVTFSTADGEITVMKSDMGELHFDTEEENLIKLAELAQDRGEYTKAYSYYDMAYKLNPNSKRAKDGVIFLQGYVYRKDEVRKEEAVKRQEAIERFGAYIDTSVSRDEEFKESANKLKKYIGIALSMRGGSPEIAAIETQSPAYEAGMRKGDLLAAIWGRLTG